MSAAEVLAQHLPTVNRGLPSTLFCSCMGDARVIEWSILHQLDMLKAAGYAVVELADEDSVADYGLYPVRTHNFGMPVAEQYDGGTRFRSVRETRSYAAALLAVADAAEAQS